MEEISCALTGHRKLYDDFNEELLNKALVNVIEKEGVTAFYNGMARGFDLISARHVLNLKKKYNIKLIACVPCKGQENGYSPSEKAEYARILSECDEVRVLYEHYFDGCMLNRDRYMVDNSSLIIAYLRETKGGTSYTVNYAELKERKIFII